MTPSGKRSKAALAILALSQAHEMSRRDLAALLWNGREEEQTGPSQRQLVRELKNHFTGFDRSPLVVERSSLALDRDLVEVDVDTVEQALSTDDAEARHKAANLVAGPVAWQFDLPDRTASDWCLIESQKRESSLIRYLSALTERALAAGRHGESRHYAFSLLRLNPTHEEAHRAVITSWIAQGDFGAALAQYDCCRDVLGRVHGIEPSARTLELVAPLKKERLPSAAPRAYDAKPMRAAPTLAVLPVICTGPRDVVDELAFVVSADLVTSLTRFRTVSVVGRPASYVYQHDMASLDEFSNADYALECRLTHNGERGRLVVQLVDGASRVTIWAEQFPMGTKDLPELDLLIERIVNIVDQRLTSHVAGERSAYEPRRLWAQGDQLTAAFDVGSVDAAEQLFKNALGMDRTFARAHAGLATALSMRQLFRPSATTATDLQQAVRFGRKAVGLDPFDARNHISMAWSYMLSKSYDDARRHFDLALEQNHLDTTVMMACAEGFACLGAVDRARSLAERARAISPEQMPYFASYLAVIAYNAGQPREFLEIMSARGLGLIEHFAWLAAAHWETGDRDRARLAMDRFLSEWARHAVDMDVSPSAASRWLDEVLCIGDPVRRRQFFLTLGQIHPAFARHAGN